ncbi:MAG: hypothetical protein ACOC3V_04435 [bacterium]
MEKVSNVLIRGYRYDLLDIPKKYHKDNTNTLWVKKDKDIFNDDIEYIPWNDEVSNRKCWNINIIQGNSMGFTDTQNHIIEGYTSITISLNGIHVYELHSENLDDALFKTKSTIDKLESLPIELDDLTKGVGRKIFYKRLPAIISNRFSNGNMLIKPDCKKEELDKWWDLFANPWYCELEWEFLEEWKQDNSVSIDMLSNDIYWFRNDREIKIKNINRKITKKGN